MSAPICRISCLRRRNPGSSHIRDQSEPWLIELDPRAELSESWREWSHHRRVERVCGLQTPCDCLVFDVAFEPCNRCFGTSHYRQCRPVGRGNCSIIRALRATSFNASSSENTPARHAATYSPTL